MSDLIRPDLAKSLEPLAGLVARGVVNTIELDAIQRELGEKWPRRKEQVWAQVENTIRSHLGESTYFLRIADASFLICLPELSAAAAQTQCARVLKDLLIFFLGSSVQADIVVHNITRIEGATITREPVDLAALATAAPAGKPPAPPAASPLPEPAERLINSSGGPLSVSFEVERVFRTHDRVLTARRIKANVFDHALGRAATTQRLESLETAALIDLDYEGVAFALDLLAEPEFAHTGVIIPINIQTIVSTRGRERVIGALESHSIAARRVFAELVNIYVGTPSGRIAEAMGLLKPRVRGVYARLSMPNKATGALVGAKLNGTVLDTMAWENFEVALARGVLAYADIARTIAPVVIAGPLAGEAFVDVCSVAGVTHYTMQDPVAPRQSIRHPKGANIVTPAPSDSIFQAVFVSRAAFGHADPDEMFDAIVRSSAAHNAADFITGMMVLCEGHFVQTIEGDRAAVSRTLMRIFKDARHKDVQLLVAQGAPERDFPKWSMAGIALPPGRLPIDASQPNQMQATQALELLRAAANMREDMDARL